MATHRALGSPATEWYAVGVARQARWPSVAILLVSGLIAGTLIAVGTATPPSPVAPSPTESSTPAQPSDVSGLAPVPSSTDPLPSGSASPSPPVSADLSDHPFTVLVLGGDNGFRTDATIVVGVDPLNKRLSLASIPRDTANVPLPDGGIFRNRKINEFYDYAGQAAGRYPQGPGRATADMVGTLLGIHVDYYVATSFDGFVNLVDALHGVRLTLPKAVVDPYYQITTTKIGVRFPRGEQTLRGDRALIFVRTRQGDNDFERQRRHQLFLLAAGRQVLAHPELLLGLLDVRQNVVTDFPLEQLPTLVDALATAGSWPVEQVVLGPRTYESNVSCSCGYALQPNLAAMRAKARALFPWAVVP